MVTVGKKMEDYNSYDRNGLVAPPLKRIILPMGLGKPLREIGTSVEIEMPLGSSDTFGTHSVNSQSTNMRGTVKSHVNTDPSVGYDSKYRGADAWWSVGDFLQPGITHQNAGLSLAKHDDDMWDLSDSIVDLFKESNKMDGGSPSTVHSHRGSSKVDIKQWIEEDTSHGFVRVYRSDTDADPRLFPCSLSTTAQKLCIQCGRPPNSLHVQLNGDIIRRLEPFDCPLAIQNEYLFNIGYTEPTKVQEIGSQEDLSYLVKFYAGKPVSDSTYSRNQLTTFAYVRKGKLLYQWVRRLCVISGTRLLIYRDQTKSSKPTIVQLAKGAVEEVQNVKGHNYVLKLTSTLQGERSVYLSFSSEKEYSKWLRKTKKGTAKLPTKADLSNCHLEFLPETVFINDELEILNLRHNVLKERPIEEDIYTIGWLDDLPRFHHLRSLNLADNDLRCFPLAVCRMRMLTELNLASNKIEDVPPDIIDIESLQMLHLHNNHLTSLPEEMCLMRNLVVIVLAFNHFTTVPNVLLYSQDSLLRVDSLIMAGNRLEKLPHEVLNRMQHIKKVDFRLNKLSLLPSEMAKFHLLELVTHLDVRDNLISDLDVRALKALEYLNCERNQIHSLQLNGGSIKTLLAAHNEIHVFSVNPKPEWLVNMDVSHNRLESLPAWISDCFFLVQLNASHNHIKALPNRLFSEAQRLKVLHVSHNQLTGLPPKIENSVLEELSLEHNLLSQLPSNFFLKMIKLRYLCVTNNQLESLPDPNPNVYQNKLQELYISANYLSDTAVSRICCFSRLKVLHMAYNKITEIHDRDLRKLEGLQELNISGNLLRHLPRCVGRHSKLQALRSNANLLKELPDFRYSTNLKVLEVGSNRLIDVSVTNLMASTVNLLDISGNPDMQVNTTELKGIKTKKKVCMVDIKGQNRSLLDLRTVGFDENVIPWQSGLSQTSGMRNKLSVTVLNRPKFSEGKEGLFGVLDGGRSDEVTQILTNKIGPLLAEECQHPVTGPEYLKYTLLSAHRKLKSTGQKVGASAAICHIRRVNGPGSGFQMNVANVGDTEVVMCRRGEAVCISKQFTVTKNKEETERICKSDGIVTEDNRINGVTQCSRLLGSSYLFPHVIPDPHVTATTLQPDDTLIIIANQGLWKYMTYQEAVDVITDIPDPVLAAKKLQDLAQGYRSQENIGVLVIRLLNSPAEKDRMRHLLQNQFEEEQKLIAELRIRDIEREELKKKAELEDNADAVPMEIVKLKGGKKRKQVGKVFKEGGGKYTEKMEDVEMERIAVKPLPQGDQTGDWELLLQRRLTEEVKDKELISAIQRDEQTGGLQGQDSNWVTSTKLKGQVKERIVTLPPAQKKHAPQPPVPPPAPHSHRKQMSPDYRVSTESLDFKRELKHPLDVDRDAVLFHQMQMNRNKNHSMSSDSIDSTQSDPAYASVREVGRGPKASSHSIEVLVHGPQKLQVKTESIGGSYKIPQQDTTAAKRTSLGDSCPTDIPMSERLKMLEERGFLPRKSGVTDPESATSNGRTSHIEFERSGSPVIVQELEETGESRDSDDSQSDSGKSLTRHGKKVSTGGRNDVQNGHKRQHSAGGMSNNSAEVAHINGLDVSQDSGNEMFKIGTESVSAKSDDGSREIMILGPSETLDVSGLYAKVNKVKVPKGDKSKTKDANKENVTIQYPTLPVPDINSNSISSLEDLLAYNHMHNLQQQKLGMKVGHKMAPPPPPPHSVPHEPVSVLSKSSSQRSIIITYL